MAKVELDVLFKKIQKDDKKEVLEFHVQGDELPHSRELIELAGNIVVLNVTSSPAGQFNAEFKTVQRDSKKTALKFNVTGDSDEKIIKLYPFAGKSVKVVLDESQMSIEEFYEEPRQGVMVKVEKDGTAAVVSENQMTLEEIAAAEDPDDTETEDDSLN